MGDQFSKTTQRLARGKILLPITILSAFIVSEISAYFIIKNRHDAQVKEYLYNLKTQWSEEYNSIIKSYKIAAEVAAQNIVADGQLKSILRLSNERNESAKAHKLLLEKFSPNYTSNTALSLKIFQVQNSAGDVLVRFQKPEAYGDNVMSFRKLFRDVHANLTSAYGFEMGRYFNAYRYVFPVIDSGKLLGSIEIGIDEQQIYRTLSDNFGITAHLSLDGEHKTLSQERKKFEKIFNTKPMGLQEAIANKQDFCFFAKIDDENYAVFVEPYFDYSKRYIGYMTLYSKDATISAIKKEFYYSFIFISIAIALWVTLTYALLRILKTRQQKNEAVKLNEILSNQAKEVEKLNTELDASYEEALQANGILRSQAAQLEISEEKFRQIFENMKSGVAVYEAMDGGKDFLFKNLNSSVERIEKIQREEIVGKRLTEIFPGVIEFGFLDALRSVYETGKSQNFPIAFYEDGRISGWRENFIYKLSIGEVVVIYDDVTHGKQAEEIIKRAYENLRKAESMAKIGNWSLELKTSKLEWSDEIFNIFEIDKDKFGASYEAFLNAIHPDDREMVNSTYTNSLQTKQKYETTHRLLMKDGRVKHVNEQCETYFDENGEPIRSIGAVQDITKLKQTEASLAQSEARLQAIIQNEPECVKIMDANGHLLYMNPAGLAMIEADSLDQVLGADVVSIIAPEYRTAYARLHKRVISGEPMQMQYEVLGLKGGRRWLETHAVPMKDGEKTIHLAVTRDIEERKKSEKALRESEERLKLAVRSGGVGIWEWDIENNILIWDDAMFALYGAKREDFSGAYDAWASRVHKDDIEYASKSMQDEVAGIKPYDIEFRVVHPDGSIHFIKANADTIRDKNGKALLMIGTNWDITKEKEAESILKAFNIQLEQKVEEETEKRLEKERLLIQQSKMAMMGEMIGAIAHQWRQPLTSLAISVQDAEMAYRCGEINEEYMRDFKTNSMGVIQKMSKTIDDFRDFFKPSKTKIKFLIEDSVNATLNIMLPQLKNSFIIVNFNKTGVYELYGYKSELEQVILICISNAKDALVDNNTKEPKIDIAVRSDTENKIILSIEDNGGGIPAEIMDRIFEPYFTTKEQGKGTGIGLYMAKEIIERQMHGKIEVENSAVGAKFIITLDSSESN